MLVTFNEPHNKKGWVFLSFIPNLHKGGTISFLCN